MTEVFWYLAGLITPLVAWGFLGFGYAALARDRTISTSCALCKGEHAWRLEPIKSRAPAWVNVLRWQWHRWGPHHRREMKRAAAH